MTARHPVVIAVDGPAAAGKGTLSRRLAHRLGYGYLDTGVLYRAVGVEAAHSHGGVADVQAAIAAARALRPEDLDRPDLRSDDAAMLASRVAAVADVREILLAFQRSFAHSPPEGAEGAVLDGRDIGTVVCPNALAKLFITASPVVRARRRLRELRERRVPAIHSYVLRDIKERDARDEGRESAPLRAAEDAYIIDTSELDSDAVLAIAVEYVVAKSTLRQAAPGL